MNYFPNYPIHRLYFEEVETRYKNGFPPCSIRAAGLGALVPGPGKAVPGGRHHDGRLRVLLRQAGELYPSMEKFREM